MGRSRVRLADVRNAVEFLGYDISDEQRAPLEDVESSVVLVGGGAGGGKSFLAGSYAAPRLLLTPLLWIVGPTYEQAQAEFSEIYRNAEKMGLTDPRQAWMPKSGQWRMVTRFGQVVETKTADDVKKLASKGPTGIIMAEAAQHPYSSFLRCQERLTRAQDPRFARWLFMSGTFEEGQPWYADMFNALAGDNVWNGRSYSVPTWCNPYLFPLGRDDPQIIAMKRALPEDVFLERMAGQPVKPSTLIFKRFDHTVHVTDEAELIDDWPVELWIDPGYSGSHYAIEVVQLPPDDCALGWSEKQEVHVVDELYGHLATGPEMLELAQEQDWWEQVSGGVIDIAGRQHPAMPSQIEVWANAGVGLRSTFVPVLDGIQRHQTFLEDPATGEPRIFVNPACTGLLDEYGKWKRKTVTKDRQVISKPEAQNCDALKAVGYGLYDRFGPIERMPPAKSTRRKYPF